MIPIPTADADTLPYWEGLANAELRIQRCRHCRRFQHFPAPVCSTCCGMELDFEPVSGSGRIETFVVVGHATSPVFASRTPYVVAWVELPEQPHLRVLGEVIGYAPEEVRIGLDVDVVIDRVETGEGHTVALLRFRPSGKAAPT
ncbi:protein of unknown function DUF35 [Mycolicibacterium rhodesiae JS60]|nr:protein of unknown function DUF35 [Mycolicibacterium rhodesiae JS60]